MPYGNGGPTEMFWGSGGNIYAHMEHQRHMDEITRRGQQERRDQVAKSNSVASYSNVDFAALAKEKKLADEKKQANDRVSRYLQNLQLQRIDLSKIENDLEDELAEMQFNIPSLQLVRNQSALLKFYYSYIMTSKKLRWIGLAFLSFRKPTERWESICKLLFSFPTEQNFRLADKPSDLTDQIKMADSAKCVIFRFEEERHLDCVVYNGPLKDQIAILEKKKRHIDWSVFLCCLTLFALASFIGTVFAFSALAVGLVVLLFRYVAFDQYFPAFYFFETLHHKYFSS